MQVKIHDTGTRVDFHDVPMHAVFVDGDCLYVKTSLFTAINLTQGVTVGISKFISVRLVTKLEAHLT